MADHFKVTVVSIGYRLAPEDPWPAGAEDCYDAAEWLVKNGMEVFGGELMFTGGEVCPSSPAYPSSYTLPSCVKSTDVLPSPPEAISRA
jgi:acetyl esterase/lipase